MALPSNDTFTEASSTALGSHTSDSGHSWYGADVNNFTVGAGTGFLTCSGAPMHTTLVATPASADYEVTVVGRTVNTNSTDTIGVCARWNEDTFQGYLLRLAGDGNWELVRYNDTTIDSGTVGGFSASTDYTLTLRCVGTTITAYIDAVSQGDNTDANHTSAGNPGAFERGAGRLTSINAAHLSSGTAPRAAYHNRRRKAA